MSHTPRHEPDPEGGARLPSSADSLPKPPLFPSSAASSTRATDEQRSAAQARFGKRFKLLTCALFLLASLLNLPHVPRAVAAPAGLPDTSRMNLLFIIIEDCHAGVWGSYGNPICKTPNMDRFARTAVQFDSAYVQAVCCNPSRIVVPHRPAPARPRACGATPTS